MAVFGTSAATVDFIVSDDFTVGGKAVVDGTETDRADVWAVYDFSGVITGVASSPTVPENAYKVQTSTLGNHSADAVSFTAGTYSLFAFQGYRSTDRIQSLEVDLGCYNGQNRDSATALCIYYDPVTGQSFFISPHNDNNQGTQLALRYCLSGTEVVRKTLNNNGFNPGDKSTCTSGSKSTWLRLLVNYVYDTADELTEIKIAIEYYSDSTYSEAARYTLNYPSINLKVSDSGTKGLGQFFTGSGLDPAGAFQAGVLVSTVAAAEPKVALDRLHIAYSRELSEEDLADMAAAFVAEHKENLLLSAGDVTAANAAAVMKTVEAYNALSSAVQALLAAADVDGQTMDVGAKIAELNTAAAPFVPTENQLAFEAYYAEQGIGDMQTITEPAVMEEALRLYNAVEATHKGNVAAQYAKISSLIAVTYVHTASDTEEVRIPSAEYALLKAQTMAQANQKSHVTNATGKINAYDLFNNNGKTLFIYLMRETGLELGLKITQGVLSDNGASGLNIQRVAPEENMLLTFNSTLYNTDTTKQYYMSGMGLHIGLNNNSSAEYKAASNALFVGDPENSVAPVINENNPYLSFSSTFVPSAPKYLAALECYECSGTMKIDIWYDADGNGAYDEGELSVLHQTPFVKYKTAVENYRTYSFDFAADLASFMQDVIIASALHDEAENTLAQQFIAEYSDVLNAEAPDSDATLAMYAAYTALDADVQVEVAALADVQAAITKAALRPETKGATIRTDIDQNIAFYTGKPAAETTAFRIKEMGSVICGLGYAVENGLSMVKGEDGTVYGGKTYAADDVIEDQLMTYLNGTGIAGKETWGIYLVARSFVVYTDGVTELTVYSMNIDDKNPTRFADVFDSTGMVIRSVNGIIKSIASALQNADAALYAAYPGTATALTEEYAGVAYDALGTLDENGLVVVNGVKDAEATVKMLMAYGDLIRAIIEQ